jgi:translocation and assembly module TamB
MKKTLQIIGYVFLGFILMLGGVYLFFQTPVGKQWLSKKVSTIATDYLKTEVKADINYHIPDWVVLENFIIKDQKSDTLLAGNSLRVDIDMWALIQSQIKINQVEVEGVYANIYRDQNEPTFNYEFLLDAFASDTTVADTTSSKLMLEVRNVLLENISANYHDDLLKNNARIRLASLETGFDKLDLDNSAYYLKDIDLGGVNAFIDFAILNDTTATNKAVIEAVEDPSGSVPLDLRLQGISLKDTRWNIKIGNLAIATKAIIESFNVDMEGIDLDKQSAQITALSIVAPELSYDNLKAPKQSRGFDYGHIALTNLNIDAEDIYGSADSVLIKLNEFAFKEKSGMNIQELSGDFQYTSTAFLAKDFLFKTNNTRIGNRIEVRHPNLLEIAKSLEKGRLSINLDKSYLGLQDIELLAPDLAADSYFQQVKRGRIYMNGRVEGLISNLNIPKLNIRGLNGSKLIANGRIKGLPTVERLSFDVKITELSTTKSTLDKFLPDSIKQQYGIPNKVSLAGKINGSINNISTTMQLTSDIGNGNIDGTFQNFVAENATPKYNGNFALDKFNLQYLLKNDSLRTVSLNLAFEGEGIEPETINASAEGAVTQAYFNGYTYNDINLKGGIAQNKATFAVESADANLNGNLEGSADLSTEYPVVKASGNLKNIDFKALNLYTEPLSIKGIVNVDMVSTNPSSPIGSVKVQQAALNQGSGFVKMGDISLQFAEESSQKKIDLVSDFAKLNIAGQFDYQTLADVLLTEVSTYFKVPAIDFIQTTTPSSFKATGSISKHPLISSFVPELTDFNTINIDVNFDNTADESLTASLKAPYIFYDSIAVQNVNFNLKTTASVANYTATINSIEMSSFRLRKASLVGDVTNNEAGFLFTVKDSLDKNVHGLAGNITAQPDFYQISIKSEGTRLYYQPWQAKGSLDIYSEGIVAEEIRFFYQEQELALNSQEKKPNAPMSVTSKQLDLKQLATAFLQDSTLVSGFFNADLVVKGLDENPGFTGDFSINELTVTQISVGELKASAANKGSDAITLDASLTGEGNNFRMFGDYNLTGKNPMDFTLDIKRLGAKTMQAFSFGEIQRADGQMSGELKLSGDPADPVIRGELAFKEFNFVLKQLGAPFSLKNQTVAFKGQSVQMDNFTLIDSTGQKLVTTGRVLFPDLPNYSYRFNVKANDFLAINAGRYANDYFFGNAKIDASMDISGVNESYTVNGDIKIVPGSNITILMPKDDGVGSEMQQVITFVDRSVPKPKKKEQEATQSLSSRINASSEITLNVQVDDKSELTVLVDELTGDYLRVRGNARLRTGFNASNELFLYGDYNITDGAYELSVSFAKRKFDLLAGSYIRWTGDPMAGDVDIKAAYTVETSLNGYFESEQAVSKPISDALVRPIDVVLLLYLKNNLLALKPSFAVGVTEEALNSRGISNVDIIRSQGVSIIKDNGEIEDGQLSRFVNENYINQQALWLLASGRFSPLRSNSTGGGFNAESVARESVSKLLSDQLNQLASNAVKGVDLNVGVASEYATETGERSTELNLGVSKTLLNDRLTLSIGRNFELEDAQRQSSEIFDNITASYKLSEDGRYRLKAYRKNQFQAIQGFVVETGIGFVITTDYNKFLEIFKRKEEENKLLLENQKMLPKQEKDKRKEEEPNPEVTHLEATKGNSRANNSQNEEP